MDGGVEGDVSDSLSSLGGKVEGIMSRATARHKKPWLAFHGRKWHVAYVQLFAVELAFGKKLVGIGFDWATDGGWMPEEPPDAKPYRFAVVKIAGFDDFQGFNLIVGRLNVVIGWLV